MQIGNEVLVVKNWFSAGGWQLPGGGMKFGERPVDTAVREIQEELDFDASKEKTALLTERPEVMRVSGLLLRYHYVSIKFTYKPEVKPSREITDYKWVQKRDLNLPKKLARNL